MVNSGFDSDYYGPHNIGDGTALGEGTAEMDLTKHEPLISFFGRLCIISTSATWWQAPCAGKDHRDLAKTTNGAGSLQ